MITDPVTALRKEQRFSFGLSLLTAFMAAMKALGVFTIGTFPWWSEAALSAVMLIYAIVITFKIRKARASRRNADTTA
jgi:membrane protein YdbS with pleckstrin-like domain